MNKRKAWKILPVWLAVSAVIIIAGIILMALLGFNTAAEMPENTHLEVEYNVVVMNDGEMQTTLKEYCEEVFGSNNLTVCDMREAQGTGETQDRNAFIFYFSETVPEATQNAVKTQLEEKISESGTLSGDYVEIYTAWHTEKVTTGASYMWRGAVAVGIVAALIYLGIRFGIGCALTGLALSVHGSLFTLAVLAIARIPVYATAPVFYAAAAAFLSLAFWLIYCIKLRTLGKESQTPVDAETAMETVYGSAWKWIAVLAGIAAAAVILLGFLATAGVRAMVLPLLIPVLAAVYQSLLLGPALHLRVKRAFDKLSRGKKSKYAGKVKKADN